MLLVTVVVAALGSCLVNREDESWIRVNTTGYPVTGIKKAYWFSLRDTNPPDLYLSRCSVSAIRDTLRPVRIHSSIWGYASVAEYDFTRFTEPGKWFLHDGFSEPVPFSIKDDVYRGYADYCLRYIRQQQCGYNPFYGDSCHRQDGFVVFSPDPVLDSMHIDVTGGWHDASDDLRYVTTSATAVLHLLLAYDRYPSVFGDDYDASGNPGNDGIPDVLNAAVWGLEWLMKMNPEPGVMYHQIADDRDHIGFKIPAEDSADYGRGKERPVYLATGFPQGSVRYRNRSTGLASLAGKFASAFATGARVLAETDPGLSGTLATKAIEAWHTGLKHPGVCQTAPNRAPYYYAEQNWTDDMETAAAALWLLTGDSAWLNEAFRFAGMEPVAPWMGADTAEHYQWYPFLNAGHILLASLPGCKGDTVRNDLKKGLSKLSEKARRRPFYNGVPFIWCSNNLTAAAAIVALEYRRITGDSSFIDLETGAVGWLLGNNPWGSSMIIGIPEDGDYPEDAHSAATILLGRQPVGGLVDGPVYTSIFKSLKGIYLSSPDEYENVQPGFIVYHDDRADYSTNEPTLDGTAMMVWLFAALQSQNSNQP